MQGLYFILLLKTVTLLADFRKSFTAQFCSGLASPKNSGLELGIPQSAYNIWGIPIKEDVRLYGVSISPVLDVIAEPSKLTRIATGTNRRGCRHLFLDCHLLDAF